MNSIRSELKGVRILLVEDNAFNALVAKEELEDTIENITLVIAENGVKAIEQIKHCTFDIVLMDVQMPVMNGYDATKVIRKMNDEKSTIPIIAMTANVFKEAVDQYDAAGMNDFIGKPFDTETLIQKIYLLTKT
ncbi:UNVERIFIED_CONTAM: hypothetical protein GTU68_013269 [Idotea baltica]|nr:hypothetical protein [Idotea baltica]